MAKQILVIGSNGEHCTDKAYELACQVGREIARRGAVLVTGGLGGVMEAASKGASEVGGLVISIIPQDDKSFGNKYSGVTIPTGVGMSRDFITAHSADAVIVVGGGAGTLIEACVAYLKNKPIIALRGSGGVAAKIADTYLDERELAMVVGASDPSEAVAQAIKGCDKKP